MYPGYWWTLCTCHRHLEYEDSFRAEPLTLMRLCLAFQCPQLREAEDSFRAAGRGSHIQGEAAFQFL